MSDDAIKSLLSFAAQTGGLVVVMAEGTTAVAVAPVALAIAGAVAVIGGCVYFASITDKKV